MSQFHDTELQQSEIVADLVVSVEKPIRDAAVRMDRNTSNPISATAAMPMISRRLVIPRFSQPCRRRGRRSGSTAPCHPETTGSRT